MILYGRKNTQPYIVLAAERTGSNLLQTYLNSHSQIVCLGEILAQGFRTDMLTPKMDILSGDRWTRNIIERQPQFPKKKKVAFIKKFFSKKYPGISALGFRIFYDHTKEPTASSTWNFLQKKPELKIIHLIRRNHLKRYLSLIKARSSGIYVSTSKPSRVEPVKLEYAACGEFFEESSKNIQEFRQFLKDKRVLEIYYENISSHARNELSKILSFLNMDHEILSTPLIKLNTMPLSEAIENYWELKECFKGTSWMELFED